VPKPMTPTDPNTHLRGSGVRTTRTDTKPAPRQTNKSAPRPSKGPASGPRGGAGRVR